LLQETIFIIITTITILEETSVRLAIAITRYSTVVIAKIALVDRKVLIWKLGIVRRIDGPWVEWPVNERGSYFSLITVRAI
jgi:hypothetical protein